MRRVSHMSVAEGCLRSLWKSGSKKEALELTRPSGGAVVQRVHRPGPAWPERLVDSAARTDAMWVPSPGPVLREGRHRQMRRAANPTDTPPRGLDGLLEGVASKGGQLATLVPVYHRLAKSFEPRPRFGTGDVRPWCIRTSRFWQSRVVTAQHAQRATTVQRGTKQHHRSPTST